MAVVDMDLRFGQVAMQLGCTALVHAGRVVRHRRNRSIVQMIRSGDVQAHDTWCARAGAAGRSCNQADRIHAGQVAGVLWRRYRNITTSWWSMRRRASIRAYAIGVSTCPTLYLLVLQLLVPSVRNADRILQRAERVHRLRAWSVVKSGLQSATGASQVIWIKSDVETTLRRKIDFLIPDEWKTSSAAAVNMGAPLLTIGPRTKLRQAYTEDGDRDLAGADGSNGS